MSTNEQAAIAIEAELRAAKTDFRGQLDEFIAVHNLDSPLEAKRRAFFALHGQAIDFFNLCEQSVGDTDLLGAHRNESWVQTKAETCLAALESILDMHRTWQGLVSTLDIPEDVIKPSSAAYASLQRIVSLFFPEQVSNLRNRFRASGLPTSGFPAMNDAEALLSVWAPILVEVEQNLDSSPSGFIDFKKLHTEFSSLATKGAQLVAAHAPSLSGQWDACDHRRRAPRGSYEQAGVLIGEVPLGTLATELRDRLSILREVSAEIIRKGSQRSVSGGVHVLLVSANPDRRHMLAVDNEAKRVHSVRGASLNRATIRIESLPDADLHEFSNSLQLHKPLVLHFSGHGATDGSLLMRDHNGKKAFMHPDGVAQLILLDRGRLRVLVLNACYSNELAQLVTAEIDCVVGMTDAVSDGAAILFAQSFYKALFEGEDVARAFARSKAMVTAQHREESDVPLLTCRVGVDPTNVRILG